MADNTFSVSYPERTTPVARAPPPEGEEILDERTRGGYVGLDALGEGPRNVDKELLFRAKASARLAGGRVVHAIRELDLLEYALVFVYEEFVIHGDQREGLFGYGVHVGRIPEVDGGRAEVGGVEAMEHLP